MSKLKTNIPDFPSLRAFVTGSYAYGIPHAKSDIDVVVFMSHRDLVRLGACGDISAESNSDMNYIEAGGTPVRFGRLNLIVCTNKDYYNVWREGTRRLRSQAPVTREFAVEFMKQLRVEVGLSNS